jgi:hypothetical protein
MSYLVTVPVGRDGRNGNWLANVLTAGGGYIRNSMVTPGLNHKRSLKVIQQQKAGVSKDGRRPGQYRRRRHHHLNSRHLIYPQSSVVL